MSDDVRVVKNDSEQRYEAWVGDERAGFVDVDERDGVTVALHTETEPHFAGQGIGTALVRGMLEAVRERGDRIVSHCSFVTAYLERHADEFGDLRADG